MIPEAYWRFLGRWWWLIGVFGVVGLGLGLLYIQNAPVEYKSTAILEINYVRTVDGTLKLDDSSRALEANRVAVELSGTDEMTRLFAALAQRGYDGSLATESNQQADARIDLVPPKVSRRATEPPFLEVVAFAGSAGMAQWLAGNAAELFATRMNDKYDLELERQREFRISEAENTTQLLKVILGEKRAALLAEEGGIGPQTTQDLIDSHSRLLSELLITLGELREEASRANVDFNVDVAEFDQTIVDLRRKVETVSNAWEDRLKAPLQVLYTLEAQPDYQLALVREAVLQEEYRHHIEQYTQLSAGQGGFDAGVTLVTRGSFAEPVLTLGLRKRYVFAFAGFIGLFIGWIMANFADNIWPESGRRRPDGNG